MCVRWESRKHDRARLVRVRRLNFFFSTTVTVKKRSDSNVGGLEYYRKYPKNRKESLYVRLVWVSDFGPVFVWLVRYVKLMVKLRTQVNNTLAATSESDVDIAFVAPSSLHRRTIAEGGVPWQLKLTLGHIPKSPA
jgi:hypothetical protein